MSNKVSPIIEAIIFDFDGTITAPGALDFAAVKKAMGCPQSRTILEFIAAQTSTPRRRELEKCLDDFEIAGAANSRPNRGAREIFAYLRRQNMPFGIISRNCRHNIDRALDNFDFLDPQDFGVIICRDDPFQPKPNPEGVVAAADALGIETAHLLTVGDFIFDIEAGRLAGTQTALLTNGELPPVFDQPPHFIIHDLRELKDIIESANRRASSHFSRRS